MLSRFRVVLASPTHSLNVGACARVAANFEAPDLRIVAPLCSWKGLHAQQYAKGAIELLSAAREEPDLASALAGSTAAIGFTRREGSRRVPDIALSDIAGLGGTVALVFGREAGGLTAEEFTRCTYVCTLQTGRTMPSLNLSHAVAVVLARLYEQVSAELQPAKVVQDVALLDELEALFSHWDQALRDARIGEPDRMLEHFRRALQRARLSPREIGYFRAYLSKTQVMMGTRGRSLKKAATSSEPWLEPRSPR